MLRLTPRLREMLADKLLDAANLAVGAMTFGQVVADRPFSTDWAALGAAMWLLLVGIAIFMAEEQAWPDI